MAYYRHDMERKNVVFFDFQPALTFPSVTAASLILGPKTTTFKDEQARNTSLDANDISLIVCELYFIKMPPPKNHLKCAFNTSPISL